MWANAQFRHPRGGRTPEIMDAEIIEANGVPRAG